MPDIMAVKGLKIHLSISLYPSVYIPLSFCSSVYLSGRERERKGKKEKEIKILFI